MEVQDRSCSPSRRTSRVEQVVGRWLRRSRDLGNRSNSQDRDKLVVDGKTAESSSGYDHRNYPFRFNVQIKRDPKINSHGLILSSQTPILVQEVLPDGPADGRLVPGDQLVKINNVAVDDLTPEQAAEIIRDCQDTLTMTILRTMLGPKSSFITPEKRAKLKSNPVKVHFAEEVEVNGHSQGNSLLFLPNVLKVYLENGQTKAFKFEPNTTVKDLVMTLKEKLSLSRIEHFALVLEHQHSVTKLLLLHDEENIQQVVEKKESHDYRCLFRVCFMPKEPQHMLLEDPVAFEYLYLQGVNDVLQERFAVEMRCNTALRLAALHIQERLASCGLSPKTNLKMITKTWGIENFVSSTLLRNMREKDLRKAISYHMKKSQSQHEPKQKGLTVDQARIIYLEELSDLKSFGGKSFSATMMLQDRESTVTLLVGARYGVSQVINHKLSILSTLTEFSSITHIELMPESERVSLVKIYLQDIKPITLLLETAAAKDMSCLIAGYCRVFVDSNLNIFPWIDNSKKYRISTEEGYVSRCGSDSDDSSELHVEALLKREEKFLPHGRSSSDTDRRKRMERERRNKDSDETRKDKKQAEEKDADTEKENLLPEENFAGNTADTEHKERSEEKEDMMVDRADDGGWIQIQVTDSDSKNMSQMERENAGQEDQMERGQVQTADDQPVSETSDSFRTDSHVLTSHSCDSLDALEEDDLISCSSSSIHPEAHSQASLRAHACLQIHPYTQSHAQPHLLTPPPDHSHPLIQLAPHDVFGDQWGPEEGGRDYRSGDGDDPLLITPDSTSESHVDTCSFNPCPDNSSLCFAELSRLVEYLPSPPEASEDEEDEEEELRRRRKVLLENDEAARRAEEGSPSKECALTEHPLSPPPSSPSCHVDFVFNFEESDARCYYKLCSSITPDSARSLPQPPRNDEKEKDEHADEAADLEAIPVLQPPPGFGDSSSEDEFYDARDRFTSPEDSSSGGFPRDFCTKRKLDVLNTLGVSDIRTSLGDEDRDTDAKEDIKPGQEGGGATETLLQLRKRSRKRRSFMETEYTSRVSYPQPQWNSRQGLLRTRHQRAFLTENTDAQMLSSDPELLVQIQDSSPTVASLTHSEWEPAQLESKPILATSSSREPGSTCGLASQDQIRDAQALPKTRKQEMEMEPDSMESKSLTDFVKPVSPAITVVRCRVDPDGKESADRRGDGKEEVQGEEEMGERKAEGQTEEEGNVLLSSNMFLPEVIVGGDKREEVGEEQTDGVNICSSNSKIPLIGAEKPYESNDPEQNLNSQEEMAEGMSEDLKLPSCLPPPAPPSSPVPPTPVHHNSCSDCLDRDGENTEYTVSILNDEELGEHWSLEPPDCELNLTSGTHLEAPTSVNEDDEASVSSTRKMSEHDTDSTNSDNVFDDDDMSDFCFSDEKPLGKDDWMLESKNGACDISAVVDKVESEMSEPYTCSEAGATVTCVNSDDASGVGLIRPKVGAATKVTLPAFNSDLRKISEVTPENASVSSQIINETRSHSIMSCIKTTNNFVNPDLANINTVKDHSLTKEHSSNPHFLFQTCSPSIMGRLSVSTLRGKIQKLPLYLSRSQESISQTREAHVAQSPAQDITVIATDTHDVTQSVQFKMVANVELPESDESDTTVTGSEVEGELFVQTSSAYSSQSAVSEVKEETNWRTTAHQSLLSLVQDEPEPHHRNQILHTGPNKNITEPITEPPRSFDSNLQRDTSGIKLDTPGPVRNAPESQRKVAITNVDTQGSKMSNPSPFTPPLLVVTTQNLNGTGLPPHCQSQKVSQSSNDGPLLVLCRPPEQHPDSPKTLSRTCSVTVCEDTRLDPTPALKSDFVCSSVLVSGCESLIEGVQMPLDACGCPVAYGSCFNGPDSFDDELTVYEFSCRTQNNDVSQTGLPLTTTTAVSSFLSTCTPPLSSTLSPSFPHRILFSSSTSELSHLLSPLSEASNCFFSQMHKDILRQLGQQHYPPAPAGFQVLRVDVDQLLSILEGVGVDQTVGSHGGRHPRDTCPAHFIENKQVLQVKARRLTAGCQKVVGVGQSPEEMLLSVSQSFQTLVELAAICLWFSGCDRCDRRNAEAVAGLADVARSFREFCLAAERASSKRSCQDLSTKLLAKQCTALTASVFCLTQLFRTLTAL
ncbi:FERM and PDZ domain-containing protein 1 [Thalassophryne amazonica]|uniref:FERM and PDZ domain-containing protein 1 n=1 Tax=Thalassophryne amazonica TaxID=390379 RepID=UPI001470B405|nr:FERM and PDZ domain-containing protein 1 [Thalassophryne amazonica]